MSLLRIATTLSATTLIFLAATGCGDPVGACHGWSDLFGEEYCYDDWWEWECEEWDAEEVNGADWYWWEGQTCAERGV